MAYLHNRSNSKAPHDLLFGHQRKQRNKRKRDLYRLHHIEPLIQHVQRPFLCVKHHSHNHGGHNGTASGDQSPQPLLHPQIQEPLRYELPSISPTDSAALSSSQKPYAPNVKDGEEASSVTFLKVLACVHEAYAVGSMVCVYVEEDSCEDGHDEEVDDEGEEEGEGGLDGVVG